MLELPIPDFYSPASVAQVWRVPYEQRAHQANIWAGAHSLQPAAADKINTRLLLIDVQNTFCLPEFELYVAGRSGTGRWTTTAACASSSSATLASSLVSRQHWIRTRPCRYSTQFFSWMRTVSIRHRTPT